MKGWRSEMQKNKTQTAPVVLVEVQSEAEEAQALVWAVNQQHQEVLDDALRAEEGGEDRISFSRSYRNIKNTKNALLSNFHSANTLYCSTSHPLIILLQYIEPRMQLTHAHKAVEICIRTENE